MAKKQKRKSLRARQAVTRKPDSHKLDARKPHTRKRIPREERRAEVATVAWMLTAVATFGSELLGGVIRVVASLLDSAPPSLEMIPNLMLFSATVTGLLCLLLTPLVYRLRNVPPPTGVTIPVVTVAVIPFVIWTLQSLR